MSNETLWIIVGFCGQGLFSLRFLIQWWRSEQEQRSVIPIEFWYFSLAGGVTLLAYAIHRADPVFVVGQVTGLLIYLRNLFLIYQSEHPQKSLGTSTTMRIKKWFSPWAFLGSLWLLLVLIPLFNRHLLPIDETRYMSVAWEMWERGDWLVPYLNGAPYPHKPPLLFWLIHLGWSIGGVNEWWPRLVPGLFSLGSLGLTMYLARQLWPQRPSIAQWAPLILLSCLWWSVFTSAIMFDILLTFFVLLGMIGLIWNEQQRDIRGWGLFSIAIGGGILVKGPVILLHLLPLALIAPWWQGTSFSKSWFIKVLISVLGGGVLALGWAIPAGLAGGETYYRAIFWGQTANRLVDSFAHEHPIWWYVPLLPLALFPWSFWPRIWRGWNRSLLADKGLRFCIAWMGLVFIGFSLISGKQLHYLLPIFPAFALLMAYQLTHEAHIHKKYDLLLPSLVIISLGVLLLALPYLPVQWDLKATQGLLWWGMVGVLLGGTLNFLTTLPTKMIFLSGSSIALSLILPLTFLKVTGESYNLERISHLLNSLQRQGQLVAHLGRYHGQYQFLGRLQPLPVVDEYNLCSWVTQHPESQLITYLDKQHQGLREHAYFIQAYRSHHVVLLSAQMMKSSCIKVLP